MKSIQPASPTKSRSRWLDADMICYAAIVLWTHYYLIIYTVPTASEPYFNGSKNLPGIEEGWLFGRKQDKADVQYNTWKENLRTMIPVALAFVAINRTVRVLTPSVTIRCAVYSVFGIGFLIYAHHAYAMFPLLWMASNYVISRQVGGIPSVGPAIIWSFNCGVILCNDMHKPVYPSHLLSALARFDLLHGDVAWDFTQLLFLLKTISYSMDYHWSVLAAGKKVAGSDTSNSGRPVSSTSVAAKLAFDLWWGGLGPTPADAKIYKSRVETSRPAAQYGPLQYVAYMAYLPLYFAGPTCTYNAFVSHVEQEQSSVNTVETAIYAVRWVIAFLLLESFQHFVPVVALQHDTEWLKMSAGSPAIVMACAYCMLIAIWLKFLVIWRFFRLWALMDGVEPPENMKRCVFNNFQFQGFWRAWHHSFNCWLLRYLYFPIGGSKFSVFLPVNIFGRIPVLPQLINVFTVFTFVVFAHAPWVMRDLKILAWGWGCAVFFAPEIIGQSLMNKPSVSASLKSLGLYGHVSAMAASINILLMMVINLIGYAGGIDQTLEAAAIAIGPGAWLNTLIMLGCFKAASEMMFETRETEKRQGIHNKF